MSTFGELEEVPSGEIAVMFIRTPHRQSHKWLLNEDGLVNYHDQLITPREAYDRFLMEYKMFKVLSADVCRRIVTNSGPRPYSWIELERFD